MKTLIKRMAAAETTLTLAIVGLVLTAALAPSTTLSAAPVSIIGYDVAQTPRSGFGCWFHDYSGTIANTGRTVSGSVVCTADGDQIANYSGGSGTLNDGVISSSTSGTHLFTTRNADDGQPITPVITLYLGGTFVINTIRFFGGDIEYNALPGALNGVTVEIGGNSIALATTPFGTPNAIGVPTDDLVDLTNTSLGAIPTDRIVLRNFTAEFFGFPFDQFSITEITVDGTAPLLSVGIDIKPNSLPNSINPRSMGKVPVAVLSSPTFDAVNDLDEASLTFGGTGDERSLAFCSDPEDVNGDNLPDLVCHFYTQSTGFLSGDTLGVLKGQTVEGVGIQGTDSVRIVH